MMYNVSYNMQDIFCMIQDVKYILHFIEYILHDTKCRIYPAYQKKIEFLLGGVSPWPFLRLA